MLEVPSTVTAINTEMLSNVKSFTIDNVTETIYRDAKTNTPILRESKYNFASSGGGMQRDLIYFNKDGKPSYGLSLNTDVNGITIEAVEKLEVLKGPQGQLWGRDATGGVEG